MKILAIETSCDETAIAVLEVKSSKLKVGSEKIRVLSNTISSQVKLHAKYGGVVPNLAAREHVKNIEHVFKSAIKEAGESVKHPMFNIDLIAVTRGPGLGLALLVGISFAKTLAWKYKKPIIGVNHLEGHIYSNWLPPVVNQKSKIKNLKQIQKSKFQILNSKFFPILNLIVSGGHTELVLMKNYGKYELVGETLDDAVGEAFDKVARLLGLGYPGGPIVSARADKFTVSSLQFPVKFPRPMLKSKDLNFSYSGLKTAVLYKVRDLKAQGIELTNDVINEICYEFQNAAIDVLIKKTFKAVEKYNIKTLMLSGGVSANKELRLNLNRMAEEVGVNYSQPEMEYTTDNAAMIGMAGYMQWKHPTSHKATKGKEKAPTDWESLDMDANLGFYTIPN